jgi:hypothetical protein
MQQSNGQSETVPNQQAANSNPASTGTPSNKGAPNNTQQVQQEEPRKLSLAELFAEDAEDLDDNGEVRPSSDDPSKPPETLEAAAKRLGLKPEQVYNVKIPMPNGAEPLTLGQMKDRVGELVDLESRELQFDQRRMKAEGELLRAQAEMREIMAMVPKDKLNPEVVNKVRQRHEDTMKRERQLTLQHIPDWQDEKRRTEEIQGINDLLSDYGFDETFLTTVVDHRALKFIRDMYLQNRRIKAALARVTNDPAKSGQRPSGKAKAPARPNSSTSNRKTGAPTQRSKIMSILGD